MLSTNNLSVGYEKKVLINDINITVKAGNIITLIGPNGSGKSTILKTITRQLKNIGGVIYLDEEKLDVLSDSDIAKKLSMVMTNRIRPELMTCEDMIETGRFPYTGRLGILSKEDHKKVDEVIDLFKLEDIRKQSFDKISDGQRQRVMLARAIAQEPEVLVLDEPTSFLDIKYKIEILSMVRQIAVQKNIAVIMSLHELELASKISDIVACVDGTKICKTGTPEEIFNGDFIQKLYGINTSEFDPLTGSVFFRNNKNNPEVFVISGGGKGISLFQKLYRENKSFFVGILHENDLEYLHAKAMASKIISQKAFYEITDTQIAEAKKVIDSCKTCICTIDEFGPLNMANKQLLEYAKEQGKEIILWQK